MAEEVNPATPKAGDSSKDDASQPAEVTTKSPEAAHADQGTENSPKADEDMTGNDSPTATGDKTQPPETTQESKPAESGSQEPEPTNDKAEGSEAGPVGEDEQQKSAVNGTPASTKNSTKRRSTGIPEHRSKKLNKKKSMPRITHLDAQPGEYYFARLKSYAPWPSIICDEEMLPERLLATRPMSAKLKDGTYNEHYQDGGKKVHERTFPVMFFHTNEFAWIPNTDLTPLNPEDCKNVPEKGKSKSLLAAYQVAAEDHGFQYFKDLLADHQRALQEDEEAREEKAKAKREKKKRKSMDVADELEDEEMADESAAKPKATKKRKKDLESEGESDKVIRAGRLTGIDWVTQPLKTPKTATKLKLTTPKAPASGETGKKGTASARATKSKGASAKKGKQPAPTSSDEEEVEEAPKEPEPVVNPAEAKAKREKEVFYLRHRLQKGFLSRDQAPKEEEMEAMSNYITKLDSYDDLEISIIRKTKIGKKWKHWDETEQTAIEKKANGMHNEVNGKDANKAPAVNDTDVPMPDADAKEAGKESEKEPTPAVAEKANEAEPEAMAT
ncbi:conserved hypothetical protein [Uncinocarpus reesii 1704]|uniref:PWWP domain-containing protein n=1 Tax=Uncinocarpus reesii (strain UAMH 1704) TaxID=336963 RepID=C4JIJ0_UNCRE|nr:uncharacterized protein UREG_01527 [Uncinocarpus reesii 1704]EEP76678.1 conserved hypothetical protein [Uncinocarpus reesii 1704]